MTLILDSTRIEAHEKAKVFERTKQLSDDAVRRDWERNAATFEEDAGRPTTDPIAQMGRPFTRIQIEQRLKQLNPNLFFEVSKSDPTKSGVYIVQSMPDELGVLRSQKKFLVGMESGISPEFSVRHVVPERVPNPSCPGEFTERPKFIGETRGWRTVVARLARSRHIDLERAKSVFGVNSSGMQSKNWKNLTS